VCTCGINLDDRHGAWRRVIKLQSAFGICHCKCNLFLQRLLLHLHHSTL